MVKMLCFTDALHSLDNDPNRLRGRSNSMDSWDALENKLEKSECEGTDHQDNHFISILCCKYVLGGTGFMSESKENDLLQTSVINLKPQLSVILQVMIVICLAHGTRVGFNCSLLLLTTPHFFVC